MSPLSSAPQDFTIVLGCAAGLCAAAAAASLFARRDADWRTTLTAVRGLLWATTNTRGARPIKVPAEAPELMEEQLSRNSHFLGELAQALGDLAATHSLPSSLFLPSRLQLVPSLLLTAAAVLFRDMVYRKSCAALSSW